MITATGLKHRALASQLARNQIAGQALRILQVCTYDTIGGAERIASNLFQTYRARGYGSWLAVGHKLGIDPNVLLIPNHKRRRSWSRSLPGEASCSQFPESPVQKVSRLRALVDAIAEPGKALDRYCGREDFRFPGTWELLNLCRQQPDIVHCHNLHGGYFDLRALPWLSQQVPIVLTLHDAWLLSGHCAHSFGCERWKTGCGKCPDLSIYPAIRRDATAYNWRRKRSIYINSRLYVSTPCQWLMQKVVQSMLAPAIVETRIIPNGVDLRVFRPANRRAVRAMLRVPDDAKVLLFAANGIRNNIWKDFQTMRAAIARVADRLHGQIVLFALGEDAPPERLGHASIRFVPYQRDPRSVAQYYQAADLYVHAARADTFPTTVLEALACGTPVVATAVGGIPEQVKGLATADRRFTNSHLN